MPKRADLKRILVIGSGPIVIGQACEFDYSGTQACKALRAEGLEVVLVNSNPATIMTDPEVADRTYVEPLTPEIVTQIIECENPDALLPTVGGQTALNLAVALGEKGVLDAHGVELIGASIEAIKVAEDRLQFREAMYSIGVAVPDSVYVKSSDEAMAAVEKLGFPVIIRPSFTLGGVGGGIAYNLAEFREMVERGLGFSPVSEILLEESVLGWKEFELEVMRDVADNFVVICSIENIDPMGVHTGDSITVAPSQTLTDREYQEMRDAAAYLESIGMSSVDVNMGCPVNKVTKTGSGASMMADLNKTQKLIGVMVDAVDIPVTAKMRLGWDEQNLTAPDLAKALEDAGVAAVFVHGRTRAQGFDGTVNLDGIRKVVEAVDEIPVVGNGDVTTVAAARMMLDRTSCTGVSIGRGAFYNPWIFAHVKVFLETGEIPAEPSFAERIRVLRRHYDLMVEVFGEDRGSVTFRKVAPWYAKRFGPVKPFNKAIVQISSRSDFESVLSEYLEWRRQFTDEDGELLPRYQLPPMVASFMQEEDEHQQKQRKAIPVPKGPIDVW